MPAAGQEVSELQVAGYTLENRDFTLWDALHSIVVKKVVIPARGYVYSKCKGYFVAGAGNEVKVFKPLFH